MAKLSDVTGQIQVRPHEEMIFVGCEHHECADQRMISVECVVKEPTEHHSKKSVP